MEWHMVGGDEEQLKIEAFVPAGDPFTKMVQAFRRMDKSVEKMRCTASNDEWKEYVDVCFTPVVLKETFKRNKKVDAPIRPSALAVVLRVRRHELAVQPARRRHDPFRMATHPGR